MAETKPRRRRIGRLRTPEDVRKYLASLIRRAERDGGVADAYKLSGVCAILLKAVQASEIEKRLDALEAQVPGKRRP